MVKLGSYASHASLQNNMQSISRRIKDQSIYLFVIKNLGIVVDFLTKMKILEKVFRWMFFRSIYFDGDCFRNHLYYTRRHHLEWYLHGISKKIVFTSIIIVNITYVKKNISYINREYNWCKKSKIHLGRDASRYGTN